MDNELIKDIVTYIFPSVITAIGYYISLKKSKDDLNVKIYQITKNYESKIEAIKNESEAKINQIKADMDAQSKLYESNAKTDLIATALKGVVCDKKVRDQLVNQILPQLKIQ